VPTNCEETASGSFDSEAENTKSAATGGFDYFFCFSLAEVPKKVYFCSEKKMTDESSRTDNESSSTIFKSIF
jgi:hypothetical protein